MKSSRWTTFVIFIIFLLFVTFLGSFFLYIFYKSSIPTSDTNAPVTITDLAATTSLTDGSIILSWTAPGDDGNSGTASVYWVRYSASPIDSQAAWDAASPVSSGVPVPMAAGSGEHMTVSGLSPGIAYYFNIRSQDEVPHLSGLSNSPGPGTLIPQDTNPPTAPTDLSLTVGDTRVDLIWIANGETDLAGYNVYRSEISPVPLTSPINLTLVATSTYNDAGVTNGRTYYYVVTAVDTSNNESLASNEVSGTPAGLNKAIYFGGSDAFVDFGNPSKLQLFEFALEFWFYWTGGGVPALTSKDEAGIQAIPLVTKGRSEYDGGNVDMNYFIGISGGKLVADFEEGPGGDAPVELGQNHLVTGNTIITTNTWHHAAATYDGQVWKVYLDGVLDQTLDLGRHIAPRSDSIHHVALATAMDSSGTPEGYFEGMIDEVRFWNRPLSFDEINTNLNQQITNGTGLVARWGLDEASGAAVSDSLFDPANGTITGTDFSWVPGAPFDMNSAPDQPVLVLPADRAVNVSIPLTLSIRVSDPEKDDLKVSFYARSTGSSRADPFTIVALPDTQLYTIYPVGGEIFSTQTNWIVNNRSAFNIAYVTHLGDITENGDNSSEWVIADAAMKILEKGTTDPNDDIPYGVTPGNHDVKGSAINFEQWFGVSRFAGRNYYGGYFGTNNRNNFGLFSASGMHFIVIHIDSSKYSVSPQVLEWADQLLKEDVSRRALIVTHSPLESTGNSSVFSTAGRAIYDALKYNPNLFMILGGHVHGEGRRQDNENNHTVYTLVSDYQDRANGGDGWLRLIKFIPADNQIQVKTYSPYLDQYETDASSQFTLSYKMLNDFELIGTVNVDSDQTASLTWPGLTRGTHYQWYALVSDAYHATRGPILGFLTQY